MKKIVNLWLLSCILTLVACGHKAEKQQEVKEDTAAKKMLQGIWLNDDDEDDVAFRVKAIRFIILIQPVSLSTSTLLAIRL